MDIQAAAKANDVAAALAAFDRAKRDGVKVSPDLFVSLLYLCSGGDTWERQLRSAGEGEEEAGGAAAAAAPAAAEGAAGEGAAAAAAAEPQQEQAEAAEGAAPPAEAPAPTVEQLPAEEVARRAGELFSEMEQSGGRLPLNEMCYTAMARLAALQGDADRAFALVQVRPGVCWLSP